MYFAFPFRPALVAGAVLALGACAGEDAGAPVAQEPSAEQRAYELSIREWRNERILRLQRPDGWLSLVGLHWVDNGTRSFVGSAADNGVRLAVGPEHLGMLVVGEDRSVGFDIDPRAQVLLDGQPATGHVQLRTDASPEGASVLGFNGGDASFIVIERAGRVALRVRDRFSPTLANFPGIDYFDIDPAFRFVARFEPHPAGQTLGIVNILGMEEAMANPGAVVFEKDGQTFRLEAVDEGDGRLFLIFADRTSGHESYPAARFLYADAAGADGTTVVDFNRAYNPPCAFTSFSTCPLPPPGNRLDLAVRAGEKKPIRPETAQ
jgi:hypothetical protein